MELWLFETLTLQRMLMEVTVKSYSTQGSPESKEAVFTVLDEIRKELKSRQQVPVEPDNWI